MKKWIASSLSVLIAGVFSGAVLAQQAPEKEQLGDVRFPVSCSAEAQQKFHRAMALYHSFAWAHARPAFTEIIQVDATCGMAWWGLAMVAADNPFGWPQSVQLKEGEAAIQKAKEVGASTQRERDYIAALELLYREHASTAHRPRALAYEQAMEQLAERSPDDVEAKILHALIVSGNHDLNDKTYARPLRAARLLEPLFASHPHHPGVAHYLIHSYDYPPIAHKGLEAAQLALPMAPAPDDWKRFPQAESVHVFARALGAARHGDTAGARREIERLRTLHEALNEKKLAYWAEQTDIQTAITTAWALRAEGKDAEALATLYTAADREDGTEKHVSMPGYLLSARELLGDLLLALGRPAEALREYEASIVKEPNRFHGLYGAARSAELAGTRDKAKAYYTKLMTLAEHSQHERADLQTAKAFLRK